MSKQSGRRGRATPPHFACAIFLFILFVTLELCRGQPNADYNFAGTATTLTPWEVFVDPATRDMYVADATLNFTGRYTYPYNAATPVSTLGGGGPVSATTMWKPQGVVLDSQDNLWVVDTFNSRVLRWTSSTRTITGAPASQVLGQQDFVSNGVAPVTAASMWSPVGIDIDKKGTLWVIDTNNLRAMRFQNAATLSNGSSADLTFGGHAGSGCNPPCFVIPTAIVLSPSGDLFVADQGRSLVFQYSSNQSLLTGIPDATLNLTNVCGGFSPNGLAFDSVGNMYLTDYNNNRMIMYQGAGYRIVPGMSYSFLWGQSDICLTGSGTATNQFNGPIRIHFDSANNIIWVADRWNHRVLGFNAYIGVSQNQELHISFLGKSAAVVLLPTDQATGSIAPQSFQVLLQPAAIDEYNGVSLVANQTFPSISGYTASTSVNAQQTQFYNFTVSLGTATVVLEYALYAFNTTAESAGVNFTIPTNAFKLTLHMMGWTCAQSSNTLRALFNIATIPAPSNITQGPDPSNPGITLIVINSTTQLLTTIRLLNYAEVDGLNVPINFSFANGQLVLEFPCFASSLLYDPDFSVTLDTGGSSTGDGSFQGGGDGSSSSLAYLALLLLIVIPAGLILVAVAVGVTVCIFHKRRASRLVISESVNF